MNKTLTEMEIYNNDKTIDAIQECYKFRNKVNAIINKSGMFPNNKAIELFETKLLDYCERKIEKNPYGFNKDLFYTVKSMIEQDMIDYKDMNTAGKYNAISKRYNIIINLMLEQIKNLSNTLA